MTMTDPIADMLTRIRNANIAFHDDVAMPSSKLKEAVARILEREGYITGFDVDERPGRPGQAPDDPDEVHERSPAHDLRPEARVAAGPARLHEGRRACRVCSAAWASRSCRPTRAPDRPRGARAQRRRRSALPGLVAERAVMSRIGKQPITVPSGVDVTIDGATVRVKGPKGQLEHDDRRRRRDRARRRHARS